MLIAVWLQHPDTEFLTFSDANAARLRRELSAATVVHCRTEADFLARLPEAEIAVVWRFEQAWLARGARLRWLVTPAAGRDYFRLEPPPELQLHYGGFHGELMGETVVAMLLAEWRGLRVGLRHPDPWPRAAVANRMRPLRGRHVVILGCGRIGGWIGKLCKPFGVRVTGVRRHAAAAPSWFEAGDRLVTIEALDTVLPEAEAVVLALPGTTGTDHLLDARRLDLLSPETVIVNVGRGNAIDEAALAARLADGRLRAAWLDVFATEPLPADSPLRRCANAVLLPHVSAAGPNYMDLFLDEFIARVRTTRR